MKKIKYIIAIALIALINGAFAQEYFPDSTFVNYKNLANICIANKKNVEMSEITGIDKTFKNFYNDLNLVKSSLPDSLAFINIHYLNKEGMENKIIVSANKQKHTVYFIGKNNQYHKEQVPKYTLTMPVEDEAVLIVYTNSLSVLDELAKLDMQAILQDATQNIVEKGAFRVPQNFYFDHDGNKIIPESIESKSYHTPMDQIELTAGIGVALDKHILVPDINAKIAFTFANKGIVKNRYSLSGQWKYFFDKNASTGKTDMHVNPFINVGYEHNFGKKPGESNWYGIEAGYLLKENGGHFDDNTFRLALTMKLPNKFTISPEFYIGEKIYPGIRLIYGF